MPREDVNIIKEKMGQMLEALLDFPKNNFQYAITENVDPTLGFTMVTNPMYNSPPQIDDPI